MENNLFPKDYPSSVIDRAQELQKELHGYIQAVKSLNPNIEYRDCVTCFFLIKLAELENKSTNE